ncbi:MAG TPA: universal stress protein [Burkholderiaceae bacterium]|nr:universal stress protein [Burkholderiaceae bacterium]
MYRKILVPLDGSATAERGLRESIALASEQDAELVLLHVIDGFPVLGELSSASAYDERLQRMHRYGSALLARAKQAAGETGVAAQTIMREVTRERPADAIIAEAAGRGCDLIVMGTHGRRGFNRLALGSEAELVVRTSPVPVLLVREPEAMSAAGAPA